MLQKRVESLKCFFRELPCDIIQLGKQRVNIEETICVFRHEEKKSNTTENSGHEHEINLCISQSGQELAICKLINCKASRIST